MSPYEITFALRDSCINRGSFAISWSVLLEGYSDPYHGSEYRICVHPRIISTLWKVGSFAVINKVPFEGE